jgi:single-stranded DNA-binding protein
LQGDANDRRSHSRSAVQRPRASESKNGRPFVSAILKIKERDELSLFVKLFAFSDHAKDELARLYDGDAVAVQGRLSVETYISVSDGKTKVGLSIVAEQILPLRQPPKTREVKPKKPAKAAEPDQSGPVFDDPFPF